MDSLFFYNFELLRMKKIIFSGIVNNPIPSIFNTNDIIFPAVFQGDIGLSDISNPHCKSPYSIAFA